MRYFQNTAIASGPIRMPQSAQIVAKTRQSAKIREIADAIVAAGSVTLDAQTKTLGLCRSTTWTLLKGNHKTSGISAKIINRLLAIQDLSPSVRAKILEYVEEKASGRYGHSAKSRQQFIMALPNNRVAQQAKARRAMTGNTKSAVQRSEPKIPYRVRGIGVG